METEDHIKKDLSILSVSESLSLLHTIHMFIPMEDRGLNPLYYLKISRHDFVKHSLMF